MKQFHQLRCTRKVQDSFADLLLEDTDCQEDDRIDSSVDDGAAVVNKEARWIFEARSVVRLSIEGDDVWLGTAEMQMQ